MARSSGESESRARVKASGAARAQHAVGARPDGRGAPEPHATPPDTQLQSLLEALPDACVYLDADDRVVRVAGGRAPGHSGRALAKTDALGHYPWELIEGEAASKLRQAVSLTRASGRPVTTELSYVADAAARYDEARFIPTSDDGILLIMRDITDRKRAEEALSRSEEKYRTLYTQTPVMLHSIDAEGRLISVSERWLQRLGYSREEVLGRPVTDFFAEESARRAREKVIPTLFETGSCDDVAYQMITSAGELVDVLLSATAERDDTGRVLRSLAAIVDVTPQLAAESELRRQEERLHVVLDQAPTVLWTIDRDLRFTSSQGGGLAALGLVKDQVVGMPLHEYLGSDDDRGNPALAAHHRALAGGPASFELNLAGHSFTAHLQPLRDADDEVIGVVGVANDVTERLTALESLAESEEKYRTLLSHLPGMAYRCANDRDWTMEFVSDHCLSLTGHSAEDLVGNHAVSYGQLIHVDDRQQVWESIQEAIDADRPWTIEYRLNAADGSERWVWERGRGLRVNGGPVTRLEGFISDVSDRHRAEESLREREQQLQGLMANIPGVAYRCAAVPPWQNEFIGAGCEKLTAYPAEQLVAGDPPFERLIHPEDREGLRRETIAAVAEGRHGELEYRIRTADGDEKWVWDRFGVTRNEDGRPESLEGLLIDVTDAHLAAEQLAVSRQILDIHGRIATVFLTSPADTKFADLLDVVRDALDSPWALFGYLDGDGALVAPAMDGEVCDAGDSYPRFAKGTWGNSLWGRTLREGRTQVLKNKGHVPGGDLRVDSALGVPLVHRDETLGIFMVANRQKAYGTQDVELLESIAAYTAPVLHEWRERTAGEKARLSIERELRESEQRYRSLYEQSPVGVFVYDAELRLTDCNETFAELIGTPRAQLRGLDMAHLQDTSVLPSLRRAIAGEPGIYEGPYTTSTSTRDLWLTLRTAPRLGADEQVVGGFAVVLDRTAQKRTEQQMEHLRLHDALTGLPNRTLFADRVAQALGFAKRKRLGFAVVALAIDRFATFVDTLGHEASDHLLEAAAERLSETMRSEDTVACFVSSEFGLLLPGIGGPAEASAAADKILRAFSQPFQVNDHELFLTVSLGVAVYPADGADPQELTENAEAAARRASAASGNGWQFFHSSMNAERADQLALEAELHRALEREQFLLHYQPIVAARSGEVVELEALLRWQHPERGIVPPLDFIPLAEESGLMVPIGAWVLNVACFQARAWSDCLQRQLRIAVNLSARQLYDETLPHTVALALRESGLPAEQLELEVTETAAMHDPQRAAHVLTGLSKLGVHIALDDFGTGYSSLSHLIRLPISTVKIDRSFVRDLLIVPEHAAVAASVIALGHRLALRVVAEGVETKEERDFLRDEGCDAIQGYLYSRPLAPAECGELLAGGPLEP